LLLADLKVLWLTSIVQVPRRKMKFATDPPYADPEAAARKLVRLAKSVKTIQGGRIYIAEIKEPFFI
jgi:hypothetical protein